MITIKSFKISIERMLSGKAVQWQFRTLTLLEDPCKRWFVRQQIMSSSQNQGFPNWLCSNPIPFHKDTYILVVRANSAKYLPQKSCCSAWMIYTELQWLNPVVMNATCMHNNLEHICLISSFVNPTVPNRGSIGTLSRDILLPTLDPSQLL